MSTGKEKCEILRRIRQSVAEKYGLDYESSECTYEGECSGACPKCDAELEMLQRQLDSRGYIDVDSNGFESFEELFEDLYGDSFTSCEINGHVMPESKHAILQGIVAPLENDMLQGEVAPSDDVQTVASSPRINPKRRKRVLYKECQIAGTSFQDLSDVWDELYEGAQLALVRQKDNRFDSNAVAVALADDFDGDIENFDFSFILGYVPRADNEYLATMLDLGWADAFECQLSSVRGHNPYRGSLTMKIYMVSKDEVDDSDLLRALKLSSLGLLNLNRDLNVKGFTYYRWMNLPPDDHNLPRKGDKVVFMYRKDNETLLYTMHCIADNDRDAECFVAEKEKLNAIDDSSYYVFTLTRGPIAISNDALSFLETEEIDTIMPETFLSDEVSSRLRQLLDI